MASEIIVKHINVNELTGRMTLIVKLTGVKVFKFRLSVACWLIAIAAKIAGTGIKIDTESNNG